MVVHKCNGQAPRERTVQILELIRGYSHPDTLTSTQRAEFQAFHWIDQLDKRVLCPDIVDTALVYQRYTLAVFYYTLDGSNWNSCTENEPEIPCSTEQERWLSAASECDWYGITCDDAGLVSHLDLPSHGLNGDGLPVELFSLTSLLGLSLGHNQHISGSIPTEIAQLTGLQYLDLDDNDLDGSFPIVYGITTLQAIDLNNNRLSGSIDTAIGQLADLVILQIENNEFNGALPLDAIAGLNHLVLFSSQGNAFDAPPSWNILCQDVDTKRNQGTVGYLQFLLANCDDVSNTCSCCSVCFE